MNTIGATPVDTLETRVGKMLVFGFEGLTAPQHILNWLAEGRLGGVILFARNIESPQQVAALTAQLHAAAPFPILIGIDQEGGTVARLRQGFIEAPSAMGLSNTDDEALCEASYRILGMEMHALGINWDYAPVLDLSYNRDNPAVGVRSFGTTPERVTRFAAAAVRGLQAGGVAACPKHFPGLGNTPIDSHLALPVLTTPLDHLREVDLVPYYHAIRAGTASIMTTHTIYAGLDPDFPATLSGKAIDILLRQELKFDNMVTSDCMEMKAIADHHSPAQSATLGALAGLDVILFSHTQAVQAAAYEGLLAAARAGTVPLARIEQANARRAKLLAQYAITAAPDPTQTRLPANLEIIDRAAQAAISVIRTDIAPMPDPTQICVIEFTSTMESIVVEQGGHSGLGALIASREPAITRIALQPHTPPEQVQRAVEQARDAALTILITRNAHLIPEQTAQARAIAEAAQRLWHVCLRNPYDADLLEASPSVAAIWCTFGDSEPMLRAIVATLFDAAPTRSGFRYTAP